jgi:DNA-binding winged helix-turn-helix (wHTH) protein
VIARFGLFAFDSASRQVIHENDAAIHLTPKAFDLLAVLIEEAPRVVQKSEIHNRLWPGVFVTDATVVGLVKELRRALQDRDPGSPLIRTSHGVGYAFCGGLDRPGPRMAIAEHWIVGADRRIPLSQGENVIGRDPASAVWLDFAGVSRRHARIVVRRQRTELEDLGSKNGTSVRETLVTSPTALHDGDRIRIGPACLTYRFTPGGLSTETVPPARPSV